MDNMELGAFGEQVAVDYLKKEGYHIRDRNWRYGKDELDIIAEIGDTIAFVEVKTRKLGSLLPPAAAVNRAKRAFMIRAADAYIQRYDLDVEARFDIFSIETDGTETNIEHIDDAFYPTLRP